MVMVDIAIYKCTQSSSFRIVREDFLWAHSMYSSRAFPYKLIDPSSTEESEVLFPLVDALNHKPNTKITWSRSGDSETGSLTFVAGQEYQVGDEIFNNYGPKVNHVSSLSFCLTHVHI